MTNPTHTLERFIHESRKVHGDRYDYSESVYIKAKVPIKILCKTHGPFMQRPDSHKNGCGCPACGKEITFDSRRINNGEFLSRAKSIHGNRFTYLSEYKSFKERVQLRCNDCGYEFKQLPGNHLSGRGCKSCSGYLKKDTDSFIMAARRVHGDKYSYSDSYVNSITPIEITCKLHGVFRQTPRDHLTGRGCQSCSAYGYSSALPASFYIQRISSRIAGEFIKYGITRLDPVERMRQQACRSSFFHELVYSRYFRSGAVAFELEKAVKAILGRESGIVKKSDLNSGFTETAPSHYLVKLKMMAEQWPDKLTEVVAG